MLTGVMLQSGIFVQGGALGDFLNSLGQAGFFSYLLPFLLLFALVFGILTKMQIFEKSKAVNAVIAIAVALMALQFSFVPDFFSQIFPRIGVGLAIILGVLIVAGLFADPQNNLINYVLLGIGVVTIAVVVIQSAGALGWSSGFWWEQNWQIIVGAIILLILVSVVIGSANPQSPNKSQMTFKPIWTRN